MISSSFSWIERVSRFCVYCSEKTIRNVNTDAIAEGHRSQLSVKPPATPQTIHPLTRRIATMNEYGEPTSGGVAIARRRRSFIEPLLARITARQSRMKARAPVRWRGTSSPHLSFTPVRHEHSRPVDVLSGRQHVDRAFGVRRGWPRPADPAAPPVERDGFVGGRKRPDLVPRSDHLFERAHDRRAVSAPASVRTHCHPLDVARPQRPAVVDELARHNRAVADQLVALVRERMRPAERVLPVVLAEVAGECLFEQHAQLGEHVLLELPRFRQPDQATDEFRLPRFYTANDPTLAPFIRLPRSPRKRRHMARQSPDEIRNVALVGHRG